MIAPYLLQIVGVGGLVASAFVPSLSDALLFFGAFAFGVGLAMARDVARRGGRDR